MYVKGRVKAKANGLNLNKWDTVKSRKRDQVLLTNYSGINGRLKKMHLFSYTQKTQTVDPILYLQLSISFSSIIEMLGTRRSFPRKANRIVESQVRMNKKLILCRYCGIEAVSSSG